MVPKNLFKRQPVAIAAVISTGIGLAIAFGVPISSEQAGAIMAFTAALTGIVVWPAVTPEFTRSDEPGRHEMPDSD